MTKSIFQLTTEISNESDPSSGLGAIWRLNNAVDSTGAVSPDVDGFLPTAPTAIIDISDLMSQVVGRQCPMTANYRVKGISVSLRNVDDSDDNDRGAVFQGLIGYRHPTQHIIDGLQMAREVSKKSKSDNIGTDGYLLSTDKSYSGFRFNLATNNEVRFATNMSDVQGWAQSAASGLSYANMNDCLDLWSRHSETPNLYTNKLWSKRAFPKYSLMNFSCGLRNANFVSFSTPNAETESVWVSDYKWQAPEGHAIDGCGGLMFLQLTHSNSLPTGDAIPDEYRFVINLEVEGWTEW